jgi:hypothetical protein
MVGGSGGQEYAGTAHLRYKVPSACTANLDTGELPVQVADMPDHDCDPAYSGQRRGAIGKAARYPRCSFGGNPFVVAAQVPIPIFVVPGWKRTHCPQETVAGADCGAISGSGATLAGGVLR